MEIDLFVLAGHPDSLELVGSDNNQIQFSIVHSARNLWDRYAEMSPAERIAFKDYLLINADEDFQGVPCALTGYYLAKIQNLN